MYLCEYLPRLGQVSIYLDTPDQVNQIRSLKFNNSTLYLQNTQSHDLLLPSLGQDSSGPLKTELQIRDMVHDGSQLVIRINATTPQVSNSGAGFMSLSSGCQLWSVKDLSKKTPKLEDNVNHFQFVCRNCSSEVINSTDYKFGEMPLEFWHELMDFWHCHKPFEERHNHNDKDYNGKLVAKPGFVYTGSTYLLLRSFKDSCQKCGFRLGETDKEDSTVKLHKWNLKLTYAHRTETFAPYLYVYHAILDKINSAGIRKFFVTQKNTEANIIVWVSGVGLNVCLSGKQHSNALKILYEKSLVKEDEDFLEVPSIVWSSFTKLLKDTTAQLPLKTRHIEMVEEGIKSDFKLAYLFPS